jgi:hypothetical protein
MSKEKDIEKQIVNYLRSIWGWCEALQSWSVMIKKGQYVNKMNLCTNWTPDIICLLKGTLYAIEVKKDLTATNKWIKLEDRFKSWETLPKSYLREENQIKHKHKILEQGWVHIITHDINEIREYFNNL